jgi:anaerobic magnesium-protoporphyrin IX monomethyl ester cyclase
MSCYDITLLNVGPNVPRTEDGRLLKPPPLGVLALTAFLQRHGKSVELLDYQLNTNPIEEQLSVSALAGYMKSHVTSGTLGVSTMGGMLPIVILALREFKTDRPDTRIVLGGAGPSNVATDILTNFAWVDVVVRGEGEETLLRLLDSEHPPEKVAGLSYRQNGRVYDNPPRPRLQDLDGLPMPAYDRLDMDRYAVANIVTARGCPFACAFCEVPAFWGRSVTMRSLDNVMDEIRVLRQVCGKGQIGISDDNLILDRARTLDFCQRLLREKLDIKWECFGRIDLLDEELMAAMAGSGCNAIFFGVESGADRILSMIGKNITADQARVVVRRSLDFFRRVYTSFVWGFPFETLEEFYDSVLLMMEFAELGARVQRPFLSLRPGSRLNDEYGGALEYSEELPLYFLEVPRAFLPTPVVDLVKAFPRIFTGFYHVQGLDFEAKKRFMLNLEAAGEKRWDLLRDRLLAGLGRFPGADG